MKFLKLVAYENRGGVFETSGLGEESVEYLRLAASEKEIECFRLVAF